MHALTVCQGICSQVVQAGDPFTSWLDDKVPGWQLNPAESKPLPAQMPEAQVKDFLGKTGGKLMMEENVPGCLNLPGGQH